MKLLLKLGSIAGAAPSAMLAHFLAGARAEAVRVQTAKALTTTTTGGRQEIFLRKILFQLRPGSKYLKNTNLTDHVKDFCIPILINLWHFKYYRAYCAKGELVKF